MKPNLIRTAAFRILPRGGRPVTAYDLARSTGGDPGEIDAALVSLQSAGRLRCDTTGSVVGSAGLSVIEDRHQIELDGRRFWTCGAYEIIGIFGALKASGRAISPIPTGQTIEVRFERGHPVNSGAVLFRPADDLMNCCGNVYEEWCPNSNLFADWVQASDRADSHQMAGRVMGLEEASEAGTADWVDLL